MRARTGWDSGSRRSWSSGQPCETSANSAIIARAARRPDDDAAAASRDARQQVGKAGLRERRNHHVALHRELGAGHGLRLPPAVAIGLAEARLDELDGGSLPIARDNLDRLRQPVE